jgi:hypothetical protein
MRLLASVLLAFTWVFAAPPPASAQTGSESNLVLTILGGVVTGHPLWTIDRQPFCLLNSSGACSGLYDTLRLSRSITSSIAIGAAATYFPRPHVGIHGELSYLGLPLDDACTNVSPYVSDPDQKHQQICENLSGQSGSGGAISLFVGVTVRAATRRAFSPYLRGNVGFVSLSRSSVEVVGDYVDGTGQQARQVISDQTPRRTAPMFGAAVGFTSPLGSGYGFRLEVRDVITSLDRATGPANDFTVAPIAARSFHQIALILGLDVVLERKRGRRY